jgi:DNA-binding CsgD family transcriptional regulator
VDAADVLLIDELDHKLAMVASTGFVSTAVADYRLTVDEALPAGIPQGRHIEMVRNPVDFSQRERRSWLAREGFKVYAAAPLFAHGKLLGLIEVFHRSELSPDNEWFSFLDLLASAASVAVDSAVLRERLKAGGSSVPAGAATRKVPSLSKAEWDILRLLVEGQTNKQISPQVHLSQNTIKFHVRQILQKTGTINRTELARRATQERWIEDAVSLRR